MKPLRLSTLGKLQLEGRGGERILTGRRKELVLLAYLARHLPPQLSRAELAALLWEDRDEARARHSLRQALHNLRQAIGDGLHVTAAEVRLQAEVVALDATAFEADLAAGRLREAVGRWAGDFLPGAEDVGGEALRGWLEAEREWLRRQLVWALERLVTEAEERAEWADAVHWAERGAEGSPYDEAAHTRLIRALRLAGRTSEAVARHAAFVRRLRTELGEEPSATFLQYGEGLHRSAPAAARPPGSTALFTPDLVGRATVFGELVSAWKSVEAGGAAVLLVVGDDGLGKTRLCKEFVHWLRGRGSSPVVLHATAYEGDAETPHSTLRRLLAPLPTAPGLAGAADPALGELSALVPSLRERFARLPEPAGSDTALASALHDVLRDVGVEAPVLLLLDDFPLGDSASRRAVLSLAHDTPPYLLILLTGRSDLLEASGLGRALRQAPELRMIQLHPLSENEVEELVASMVSLDPESRRSLAHRLFVESGGTPHYVVELVSALADEGLLSLGTDGAWHVLPALEERGLPLSMRVHDYMRERLDRLDSNARRVLEAAASLGTPVEPSTLEEVAGLPLHEFSTALDALIARRLLRLTAAATDAFEFTHEVVRRVAREQVSPGRRHTLRQELARRAGRPPEIVPTSADVVILPFSVTGPGELRVFGEGMLDLLTAALDGTGGLRCADPRKVLDLLSALHADASAVERGRQVAEQCGARWFVLGTLVAVGGKIRIGATVYSAVAPVQPPTRIVVDGAEADLLDLLDRTAVELLLCFDAAAASGLLQLFQHRSASIAALRAYLDGESALRRGELDQAIDRLRAAISQDPEFALAHYRLAHALEWTYQPESPQLAAEALLAAARLADRLPEQMRVLVRARVASMRGAGEEAVRLFRSVTSVAPDNIEAWYGLGCAIFHYAQLWGATAGEAREAFEQVLTREPEHLTAAIHLAAIAALENRGTDLLELTERILQRDQRSVHFTLRLAVRMQLAYGLPDPALQEQVLTELRSAGGNEVVALLIFPFLVGEDLDAAARAMNLMTERGGSPVRMAIGHALRASLELARGRWAAAQAQLQHTERIDSALALEYLGLFACSSFLSPPAEQLLALRERIRNWTPLDAEAIPSSFLLGPHVNLQPLLFRYLEGSISARLEDWGAAEDAALWLEKAERPNAMPTLGPGLALRLRTRVAAARGLPEAAVRIVDQQAAEIPWHCLVGSGILSGAHERYLLAEQLLRLGRLDEARRWFSAATGLSPFDVVLLAPAALRCGEIAEATGDHASAMHQYRRFLKLWSDCDPDLTSQVEEVAQRLARLEMGEPPPPPGPAAAGLPGAASPLQHGITSAPLCEA